MSEKWNAINNELRVLIDPFMFMGNKNIDKQVLLISTFQRYSKLIEPNLCKVSFYFPKYEEKNLGLRRTFMPGDEVIFINAPPENIIEVFPIHENLKETEIGKAGSTLNEFFTIAIREKCVFYLSEMNVEKTKHSEMKQKYNLEVIDFENLCKKIEAFTQGFYNYFKFNNSIYGIDSPDIAISMSDEFYNSVLVYFESAINKNLPDEELKERIRSFVHNRYIDILMTINQITFFKLQQKIYDIKHGYDGDRPNNRPHLHGYLRYYINYYLFLVWGAIDHLAWIINDIFSIGYTPENSLGRRNIGLAKEKVEFLTKVKKINLALYNFIVSEDFQTWLFFISKLRHTNAHREMFSASPLLITTTESQISDEEIDKIIYKDAPPVPKEIEHLLSGEIIENQKIVDRTNYRISKMKKGIEHFALIKKDGQEFLFDPISRIPSDLKNIRDLTKLIFESYNRFLEIQKLITTLNQLARGK